ncbi:arginine--tRNA ligase [Staphylococcus saprophyticus]|uniref:arginine--tRNA ligase n=1 Tax=Staphylococcus saprophyticus TaxID=29385 RepID=UPI0024C27365|nr:arginine--tRNA ligase [Staphylococcus saprophyticus]MDK1672851.1 arginine--tRNA ligase [Staphylococcus saprophyticus]
MKSFIIDSLYEVDLGLSKSEINSLIEVPKYLHMGEYSFPCFKLAKQYRKNPSLIANEITTELKSIIDNRNIYKVESKSGYVNFYLNRDNYSKEVLKNVLDRKEDYGSSYFGKGKTITMDISSPNIAKPFSMGHLRSTVIGSSMYNIAKKCGFKVYRINHIGDWGTQFGKLIVAYNKWGNKNELKENPIEHLFNLYTYFHQMAEEDESLNEEGREAFKRLENGEQSYLYLWKLFKDYSIQSFEKIYNRLGVNFDSYDGESFYNDKMEAVVDELEDKLLLETSEGAEIVKLENLPPALIKKSNGSTLYLTRDLATAIYRKKHYNFDESYYFVGNEQSLHFEQLKIVLEKMGYNWHDKIKHIPFGMILNDGKKMSTRKGRVVFLEDVLDEAKQVAINNIKIRNSNLEYVNDIAEKIAISGVIFHDLKHFRNNNINFDINEMLKNEGATAMYIHYSYARANSILDSHDLNQIYPDYIDEEAWPIINIIKDLDIYIKESFDKKDPSIIAKVSLDLAAEFNKFYSKVNIKNDRKYLQDRLLLLKAYCIVIKELLNLLNIPVIKNL